MGSYTCSCDEGYRLSINRFTCIDIDECAEKIDMCSQNCSNTKGSYSCSCQQGYQLDQDGFGCSDIDECLEEIDYCDQNCTNTIGSYICSCLTGYYLNEDQHGCDGEASPDAQVLAAFVSVLIVECLVLLVSLFRILFSCACECADSRVLSFACESVQNPV